jgi:hypothetical protein
MDRRTFSKLAGLGAFAALADGRDAAAQDVPNPALPKLGAEVVLEDAELLVAFDSISGALVRMVRKSSNWVIERRPELGLSFRLLAPLPKRRDNFVIGSKQRAAIVQTTSTNEVKIHWENLTSEHGGELPIGVTATITLEGGILTFLAEIANHSELTIETIDYPYFGDLTAPSENSRMEVQHMWIGALFSDVIHPTFGNAKGYWGVLYPTKTIESSRSLFCLLQTEGQGLYCAVQDIGIRYLVEFTFEQHPGVIDWVTDAVPKEDAISGYPVHLNFSTCHFAFVHPKSNYKLSPIVMKPYSGDWHAGLDVYNEWRKTWFGHPRIAPWARDVHSWLQLQIDGAEQDYRVPYKDLVQYGKECAENGVTAIQLVGWNHGGQDGGDPSLDTDPGLGTWQELYDAVQKIQAMGVHMIMFGKPIFADMSTEYYKKELYEYECVDMWGNKYESGGYAYTTPTQLAGINQRRRAIMDVCDPAYRDVAVGEFKKTLALGADGWLFDEVMQHNGVLYNFAAGHGYEPPGYQFSGDVPLVKEFRAAADKVSPDFLFSGEGPNDWEMPYYTLGYYRISTGTKHALRYLDSQAPLMAAVRGFDARDEVNLCLVYRYIISYEAFNFKGRVTDFPLTLDYGKKVDAFRRRHRKFLWDAQFRDTLGAEVTADGSFRYAVYIAKDGKRGVALMNLEQSRPITIHVKLPNEGSLISATPEEPDPKSTGALLKVPARSAAIVMES